jgi:hypothetical protein
MVGTVTNLTVTREATDRGVKVTANGERADGSKIDAITDAKYAGKPVNVQGTTQRWNPGAFKQIDSNTVTEERTKTGGKVRQHCSPRRILFAPSYPVRPVASKDGRTTTATRLDGSRQSYCSGQIAGGISTALKQ